MTAPLLEIRKVTACYGVLPILHGIDLHIDQGEIVALIGGNGTSKTTLMMTIFGRPRAREGHILFQGRDITAMPTHEVARLGVVQSPEGRRIFSRMTVLENLQMGAIVASDSQLGRLSSDRSRSEGQRVRARARPCRSVRPDALGQRRPVAEPRRADRRGRAASHP